jgi:hypothetical protein
MSAKSPTKQTNSVGYSGTGLATVAGGAITDLSLSVNSVLVQADPDNAGTVWVGFEMGQVVQMAAGDVVNIDINNPIKVHVRGSDANQRYNWLALGS